METVCEDHYGRSDLLPAVLSGYAHPGARRFDAGRSRRMRRPLLHHAATAVTRRRPCTRATAGTGSRSRSACPRKRWSGCARSTASHAVDRLASRSSSGKLAARGDAAATDHPGVALSVKVADCVPILLADARTGVVAAVPTRAGAARPRAWPVRPCRRIGRARSAPTRPTWSPPLARASGRAATASGRGTCAHVRWPTAAGGRRSTAGSAATPVGTPVHGVPGTPRPSGAPGTLPGHLGGQRRPVVARAGVPPAAVHVSRLCTSCHREIFHSYRVDGSRRAVTGMVGVIRTLGAPIRPQKPEERPQALLPSDSDCCLLSCCF